MDWVVIAAVLGLLFIYLEFFLPGAIMGSVGVIALIISFTLFLCSGSGFLSIGIYLLTIALLLWLIIFLALKKIRSSSQDNTLFLKKKQEGYRSASFDPTLLDKKGEVFSDLKPSGQVMINGKPHQALSQSGYLEKGTLIEVIGGKGNHLIVQSFTPKE